MIKFKTLAAALALFSAYMVSAEGEVELAELCIETAVEATAVCVAAILTDILVWGIELEGPTDPKALRTQWFMDFTSKAEANSPNLNVLAIATYYGVPQQASGVGQVIGDCGHTHHEIPIEADAGTTQGVEIYTVGPNSNCCVEKWGDGGWSNWGYYGSWTRTSTASGSQMLCLSVAQPPAPPPPQPPSYIGMDRYSINKDLVTVNGVVGRLTSENEPLYSFNSFNSLYKWQNSYSGPYYQATMQKDGNFAVYYFDKNNVRSDVFYTNTGGKSTAYWELIPQHDGNLVLYESNAGGKTSNPTWDSNTSGINVGSGYVGLSMQQDSNLMLYAFYPDGSCDPIWGTAGSSPGGKRFWPHGFGANSNRTDFVKNQQVLGLEEL